MIIDSQSDALDININELEIDSTICLFTRLMNKLERFFLILRRSHFIFDLHKQMSRSNAG